MLFRLVLGFALVALLALHNIPVSAQSCPAGSQEIGRSESATAIKLTCRCNEELWLVRDRCVAVGSQQAMDRVRDETNIAIQGLLGKAISDVDELQDYAIASKWSAFAKTTFLLSTISAARGSFERAQLYLASMLPEVSNDEIATAFAEMVGADLKVFSIRQQLGPLLAESSGNTTLDGLMKTMNSAQTVQMTRALIEASVLRGEGRYEAAAKLYQSAGQLAAQLGHEEIRREAADARIYTQALKTARDVKLDPARYAEIARRGRERLASEHAWELALKLQEAGKIPEALALYGEAIATMKTENPRLAAVVSDQMEKVKRGTFTPTGSLYRNFYRNDAPSSIVLDAVTYGKGDWKRSIRYLEMAKAADPDNARLREALGTVIGLSASANP
jgi:tetratricopeptide (TPR) repeat protein